ncbi:MAG TPA: DNA-formamidopyrimidine glycosylase family protein [Solirubrobacterales bacterium]|nr:DNA-formamidopyrimidine glycosylase family protein [Solirubrobacterales bacterium]
MPELPEVEITARLLGDAVAGMTVESVMSPGLNTVRTFKPPIQVLEGHRLTGIRRRGKIFILDSDSGHSVLIHLMSAGRLQLFEKRAGPKDRRSRLLIRLDGGSELRLREFGTHQRAWAKVVPTGEVESDETLAGLGPEAWPDPPDLTETLDSARPLYTVLRDQRVIAGIGRSWVDEILWTARLSPFKRGNDLSPDESSALRDAVIGRLGGAIELYETELSVPLPDKLPLPLQVHRHEGEPCPRCGSTIEAVHYKDYVMCYCPADQTDGRSLKDRRLSKLLK